MADQYQEAVKQLECIISNCHDEAFLEVFRRFCSTSLPRNPKIRESLALCIHTSSKTAALMPFSWYRRETLLPPIPQSWQEKASQGLQGGRITHVQIENVNELSLQMLRPGKMINDEIVEGYLNLIRRPGVIVSSTRLFQLKGNSKRNNPDSEMNYQSLVDSGQAFIPIHHHDIKHWTFARLVAIEATSAMIVEHYDSLSGIYDGLNSSGIATLEQGLKKRFPGIFLKIVQGPTPRQLNSVDCGLFMLMGIRVMAAGSRQLSQPEADEIMPTFRERVLVELLAGTLDPTATEYASFVAQDREAANRPQPTVASITYPESGGHEDPINLDKPSPGPDSQPLMVSLQPAKFGLPEPDPTSDSQTSSSKSSARGMRPTSDSKIANSESDENVRPIRDCAVTVESASPKLEATPFKNSNIHDISQQAKLFSIDTYKAQPKLPKPHESQRRKRKHSNLTSYVDYFADEQSMVNILKSAVQAYRIKRSSLHGVDLASMFIELNSEDNPQHALMNRHGRERFSRMFHQELRRFGGGSTTRVKPHIRAQMQRILKCESDLTVWKVAQAQARKSSIWTELVDCVSQHLGDQSHVAICACYESTTTLESLVREERITFIEEIQSRLQDQHDHALQTLRAAIPLYSALTGNKLPDHKLQIEKHIDLKFLTFAAVVSLDVAPHKLPLPK